MKNTKITNRRDFIRQLGLGGISLGLLSGLQQCKGDTDSVKPFNPYTFMSNPNDPLILKVTPESGELIEYYGSRDAQGIPQNIDVISYRSRADKEEATYCYFDTKSNLSKIITEDGSTFSFKWSTASKALLTFSSGDKANQLSTEIDFDQPGNTNKRIGEANAAVATGTQARQGKSLRLSVSQQPMAQEVNLTNARIAAQSLEIDVKKCGFPADANVWVYMYKYDKLNNLVKVGQFPAVQVTKGRYSCYILPNDAAEKVDANPQKICQWAIEEGICSAGAALVSKSLCLAITAIAGTYSAGTAVNAALAACNSWVSEALEEIISYGCGKLIDDTVVTQKAYEFCGANFENRDYRIWTGNLLFIAKAEGVGTKPIYSKSVEIDGKSSFPTLSVDLGGSPSVNSLVLQPAKPVVNQSYVAQARLNCLPYGTRLTLSVVGTDGYQDSASTTVSSLLSDGTFTINLEVPGAKSAGIADVVTLVADLPNGAKLNQTASLVFG